MQQGFLQTAAAAPLLRVADAVYNGKAVAACMEKAAAMGVKLLVLPELSLTGITAGDLLLSPALLQAAEEALGRLLSHSVGQGMLTAVGMPLAYAGRVYDCAVLVYEGDILGIVPKAHIPPPQRRWFASPPGETREVVCCGRKVPFGCNLLFVCEALPFLSFAITLGEDLYAPLSGGVRHAAAGANLLVHMGGEPETVTAETKRRGVILGHSAETASLLVSANAGAGESSTDGIYGGHCLIAENGHLLAEALPFLGEWAISQPDLLLPGYVRQRKGLLPEALPKGYTQIPFTMEPTEAKLTRSYSQTPFLAGSLEENRAKCRRITEIQSHALAARIAHTHAKAAIVGVSGGLDSTLALLIGVKAMALLGRSAADITAVTMPGFGTTGRTKGNAEGLAEALGTTLRCIPVGEAVSRHFADIGHDPAVRDAVYENAQARERTQVLMDLANQLQGLVVGTGDLSELALGWTTYNGDQMSMYGVNASLPKTVIRAVVGEIAEEEQLARPALADILRDVLDTPVSPELLPPTEGEIAQVTEDLVGPYTLHDFFLYHFLHRGCNPGKLLRLAQYTFAGAYTGEEIRHWLTVFVRRFFSQQFKRSCMPDGPAVGSIHLSPRGGWVMPSDASSALWTEAINALL